MLLVLLSQFLYLKVAIVVPTSGAVWRKFLTHSEWINKYWISLSICVFVFSCNNHLLSIYYVIETQFSSEEMRQRYFYPLELTFKWELQSVQSLSHVWLCDRMDCSTPGLPVHHQLSELTQIHVHCISDAIQPSHPLSSPTPPAFNLSQHQGLFQCVSPSHQVAKVLEFHLQHQSFQWILTYFL